MTTNSNLPADRYWITLDPNDLWMAVAQRFDRYFDELERRGRMKLYRLARQRYYGGDHSGHSTSAAVTYGGEQGEASELTINHYGSIMQSLSTSSALGFRFDSGSLPSPPGSSDRNSRS